MSYRPHYLTQLNWYNLNIACETVYRAFDSMPYLVGSALTKSDYRDVDIRVILDDVAFGRLFPLQPPNPVGKCNDNAWEFICNATSEWLRARTGLPVDFQIQQRTAANEMFEGARNACGMFISSKYNLPTPPNASGEQEE